MRSKIQIGIVALVAFIAGLSVAAVRPDNSYHEAARAIQGEYAALHYISPENKDSHAKAIRRAEHWLRIMEKFEP